MEKRRQSLVSRPDLLRMTMLTQRAVDYSIKAYEYSSYEFCRHVYKTECELNELQLNIGDRGCTLLASGSRIDSSSPFVRCTLRIYNALKATYRAAGEIARNTATLIEGGCIDEPPATLEVCRFVNGQMRLCTVALFKREIQHAKTVLQINEDRRKFDLSLYRAHNDLIRQSGKQPQCELAVIRGLGQISEQACEIASAITLWLEDGHCLGTERRRAPLALVRRETQHDEMRVGCIGA